MGAQTRRPQRRNEVTVSHEAIAMRAYELYEARGSWHGSDLDDWLAAEIQLHKELSVAGAVRPRTRRASPPKNERASRERRQTPLTG